MSLHFCKYLRLGCMTARDAEAINEFQASDSESIGDFVRWMSSPGWSARGMGSGQMLDAIPSVTTIAPEAGKGARISEREPAIRRRYQRGCLLIRGKFW